MASTDSTSSEVTSEAAPDSAAHSALLDAQTKEVEQMKLKCGKDCRVIVNIGEFSHVLTVKLKCDFDISIKFQLEATYPQTAAHVVVKSKTLPAEDVDALAVHLAAFAERHEGKPMLRRILDEAQKWLKDQPTQPSVTMEEAASKKSAKSKKKTSPRTSRKQKQERQLEEEGKDKKLSSMKQAMDVVSRILWDDSLNSSHFTIGYLDRMLGVVEKKFEMFSWEDVASVDYNTLAIPKHRIQYFKYKDVMVWDKNKRLDDVFGTTGGKTIDEVIQKYERDHPEEEAAGGAAAAAPNQNYDNDHDDEDSDDDGITINTGYQLQNAAAPGVTTAAHVVAKPEEEEEAPWEPSKDDKYWGPKKRPTHFLALRITDPDVVAAAAKLHEVILNIEPKYAECIIPPERLHITLACLGLDSEDDIAKAREVLGELKQELLENWQPHLSSVSFEDVGNFFHSVLYAKVIAEDKFMKFVDHLRAVMVTSGVEIRDVFEFTPHMTLVKLKRQLGREVLHTRYLDHRLYTELSGSKLGSQIVDNIYLCEMSENREPDGFYVTHQQIFFP